ncbi:MAG: helix-turn-helix domain-containing protein [Endomicrobium sp.]|jgi:transcriptional regulator with XRE-family HTH domain|nr:helix-turn-helix domain-containing protein [Endomicrobium sp.]
MDNILTIKQNLANRVRKRRKEIKLSQLMLSCKSQVSLGSIKRFERSGEISLSSLLRIAVVLDYEADFNQLFTRRNYQNLDEIINAK